MGARAGGCVLGFSSALRPAPAPATRERVGARARATSLADGRGEETEAPLEESFDVGLFSIEPGREGYDRDSVIAVERTTVRSGSQTLRLVADREPKVAGVDPFNKRVDRNSEDNLRPVDAG